jgi:cytidylate kinase
MPFRITIAGDIGSGKSTVARKLAALAGIEALSTGGIQRQLAQQRGLTVLELNRLAEDDASIDREIDGYLMALPAGDLVVESRMAWHFVPDTLRLYLYISDIAAARRIVGAQRSDEDYRTIANATEPILARRRSEVKRFRKYYDVDIDDLSNYDLVIDTTFASVDDIIAQVKARRDATLPHRPLCLIDPRNLVPTRSVRELAGGEIAKAERNLQASGFDAGTPLRTLYVNHVFHVLDGHARCAAAARSGAKFVACTIAASGSEPYRGVSAREYVREAVREVVIREWQEAAGFRYDDEVWRGRDQRSDTEPTISEDDTA